MDRGDHGVLLRLRRDLQRRHRPRQPGRRRLPAAAQRVHRRDPPGVVDLDEGTLLDPAARAKLATRARLARQRPWSSGSTPCWISGAPSGAPPRRDGAEGREALRGDPRRWTPDADDRQQPARPVEHRGRTPQADASNSPWQVAYPRSRLRSRSACSCGAVGDRRVGVALEPPRHQASELLLGRPGQQHLARRGGVQAHRLPGPARRRRSRTGPPRRRTSARRGGPPRAPRSPRSAGPVARGPRARRAAPRRSPADRAMSTSPARGVQWPEARSLTTRPCDSSVVRIRQAVARLRPHASPSATVAAPAGPASATARSSADRSVYRLHA